MIAKSLRSYSFEAMLGTSGDTSPCPGAGTRGHRSVSGSAPPIGDDINSFILSPSISPQLHSPCCHCPPHQLTLSILCSVRVKHSLLTRGDILQFKSSIALFTYHRESASSTNNRIHCLWHRIILFYCVFAGSESFKYFVNDKRLGG